MGWLPSDGPREPLDAQGAVKVFKEEDTGKRDATSRSNS